MAMSGEPRTLVIQERKRFIRVGLADVLDAHPQLVVVDAVDTADELRAATAAHRPDAAVIELDAPWDLRSLVSDLRSHMSGIRITALHHGRLTDHGRLPTEARIDAAAAYGGGAAAIISAVLAEPVAVPTAKPCDDRRRLPSRTVLTPREQEVLRHLAEGMTAASCARALRVSPKTVDNHKQRIFSKLGVQNQAHAVALAHRIGLLGRTSHEQVASG
jgi:DNA-binding NarL/FixJ family response regulator